MKLFKDSIDHDTFADYLTELERLIPQVPDRCPAGCSECCGPQFLSAVEATRMGLEGSKHTGCTKTFNCALLTSGGCSVYENRPFVCKLFGTTNASYICRNSDQSKKQLNQHQEQFMFELYFRGLMKFDPETCELMSNTTEEGKEIGILNYIHDYLGPFKDNDALKRKIIMPERFKGMDIDEIINIKREELQLER